MVFDGGGSPPHNRRSKMKLSEIEVGTDYMWDGTIVNATAKNSRNVTVTTDDGEAKVSAKNLEAVADSKHLEPVDGPEDEDEGEVLTMSEHIRKYRPGYAKVKSYTGSSSLNNNDAVATCLAGLTPDQVCTVAEGVVFECPDLSKMYNHLNPGQKRMNAGNRIRAAIKRGDITSKDVEAAAGKMEKPEVIAKVKKAK
jgi:hypothetical protein